MATSWPGNVGTTQPDRTHRPDRRRGGPLDSPFASQMLSWPGTKDAGMDSHPSGLSPSPQPGQHLRPLREVEDEHIRLVLGHCGGNKSQAARILGLSRQGLLDRLKRGKFPSEAA